MSPPGFARDSEVLFDLPLRVVRDVDGERVCRLASRVSFEMQANGSRPVIPLYLPVPPVMRWVPQSIFGCALSRSRVSKRREYDVAVGVGQRAGAVDPFLPARTRRSPPRTSPSSCRTSDPPAVFSVGPTASSATTLPTPGMSTVPRGSRVQHAV